jgi:hypothetical protein
MSAPLSCRAVEALRALTMGIELELGSDDAIRELVVAGLVRSHDLQITELGHETLRAKTEKAIVDCLKWMADHPSSGIIC